MVNYVSIINRSEFNDLYRYGHLFVHNVVPFEGELSEHAEDKPLFNAVTAYMNTYEYSTEYLVLHFRKCAFAGSSVEIFIKEVVGVFALDHDAHASLSASLDPRINLQVTCWTTFFMELRMKQSIRQSKAGMFNCFEIFGIPDAERKQVYKLMPQYFVEDLFIDLFNKKRPDGNKWIWTYLMRYERHHAYWKDMRGYFSDAIHVYENFINKHEIDYEIADEVPLGDKLSHCGTTFSEIYRTIMAANPSQYSVDGCNYFAVAPLFLFMSDFFKDGGLTSSKLHQNLLLAQGKIHEKYGLDFAFAIALLGIKLGQELTYSCYYEVQRLGIFNKSVVNESKQNIKDLPIVDPETGKPISSDEAQDLLNNQRMKIEVLSSKVHELELSIQQKATESQPQQDEEQQPVPIEEQTEGNDVHKQTETNSDLLEGSERSEVEISETPSLQDTVIETTDSLLDESINIPREEHNDSLEPSCEPLQNEIPNGELIGEEQSDKEITDSHQSKEVEDNAINDDQIDEVLQEAQEEQVDGTVYNINSVSSSVVEPSESYSQISTKATHIEQPNSGELIDKPFQPVENAETKCQ